jgi:NAD(P)H-hydrate epimerase
MKILKANEMAFADENTIKLTGIPSLVLMENAGRTSAEIILRKFKKEENFVIIAGSGNNGGDGIVIGRYLRRYNKKVKIFLLSDTRAKLSADNLKNLEIFETDGGEVLLCGENKIPKIRNAVKNSDVVIDAIFGTGFRPPVKGYREKVIEIINKYAKKVVSVDIPSGLSANTGKIEGSFVKADLTTTFAYPKFVHILYPASEFCGEIYVIDISIDENYLKEIHRYLLTPEKIELPERKKNSHKYNYGHVLVIGGSVGKTGAVIMASKSANVSGAGLVTAVIPKSLDTILEQNLIEEMTIPVDEKDGLFGKKSKFEILDLIKNGKFSSIALGMGMSVNKNTVELVDKILKVNLPLVIDADGLNNLSLINNFQDKLRKRKFPTVLTPHVGEMSRLTNIPTKDINDNLEDVAKEFAKETNTFVVLKSSRTVIATPDEKIFYSIRGNEGMATAGTGDVLSGILGCLVNRLPIEEAVKTGVYLHGLSGDLAVAEIGKESLKATDLIKYIPKAYKYLAKLKKELNYSFFRKIS